MIGSARTRMVSGDVQQDDMTLDQQVRTT